MRLLLLSLLIAIPAHAQFHKCVDPQGRRSIVGAEPIAGYKCTAIDVEANPREAQAKRDRAINEKKQSEMLLPDIFPPVLPQETMKVRLAAARGDAYAQSNLGYMYENGIGIPQDYEEAAKWYRLAAAQGHTIAQNNLNALYKKLQAERDPYAPPHDLYAPPLDPYAPPLPGLPAATPAASTPIGEVNLYPQAADVNTTQPRTESRRGSVLNRTVQGAIGGLMLGVIAGLFILVRYLIRKAKAPANDAAALTTAAGATPMQMRTDQQDLYPVKRAPNNAHQMNDNQKLLCIGIIAIIVAMAVYPPFQVHLAVGTRSVGYGWIFSPPYGDAATIDVAMLIAQWVIVLGIGAIAFILLRKSSQELPSVPPTGPSLPKIASPAMADPGTEPTALGTKWLKFWNYFSLPVGGILCILLVFAFATPEYIFLGLVLAYAHFHIAYGLHRRVLEAWKWNWVMVVATWIGGSIPYHFGTMLDFTARFAITFLLFGAIWMWPNYVYWMKRRVLFS